MGRLRPPTWPPTNPYSGVVSDYVHSETDFRDLQVSTYQGLSSLKILFVIAPIGLPSAARCLLLAVCLQASGLSVCAGLPCVHIWACDAAYGMCQAARVSVYGFWLGMT